MNPIPNYKNVELQKTDLSQFSHPTLRNEFIAKLENAIMFLNFESLNMWHNESKKPINLKTFDGSWLVDYSLNHDEEKGFAFPPFGDLQVTPEMFPDLNIKFLNLSSDVINMFKYKFLTNEEKRGLDKFKYIISEKVAVLDYSKSRWFTNELGYGLNSETKLADGLKAYLPIPTSLSDGHFILKSDISKFISEGCKSSDSFYIQTIKTFNMALNLNMTYYYEWSCYIKENEKSIGIRIPIHPSSSKDIFSMRDSNDRKKAIVNFVKDHYRTITDINGSERDILIQKHFRGDLKFNWRGLEVHITPSQYDLNRIKTTKKFRKF